MGLLTWERNPISAMNSENPSVTLINIKKLMLEVSCMNVINVKIPCFRALPLDNMIIGKVERKHLNALYVGKSSVKVLTLDGMR